MTNSQARALMLWALMIAFVFAHEHHYTYAVSWIEFAAREGVSWLLPVMLGWQAWDLTKDKKR